MTFRILAMVCAAEAMHRSGNLLPVARIASQLSRLGYHLSDPQQTYGRPNCQRCGKPWRRVYARHLILSECCK